MSDGISSGLAFPVGINVGTLHYKIDQGLYYRYIGGGNSQNELNWVVFGGSIPGDPDTTGWGGRQEGALWFNSTLNILRVWNGTSVESVGVGAVTTVQQNGVSSTPDRAVLNVVGRNALISDVSSKVQFRMNDPATMSYVYDEFIGGGTAQFQSGAIGDLGWFGNGVASGVIQIPTLAIGDVSHPGVKRLTTGITINSTSIISLPNTTSFNVILFGSAFDALFIVDIRENDGNVRTFFGLSAGSVPYNGVRIVKEFADTEWFAEVADGASGTRSTLGAVVAGQWEKFRIRKIDSATVGFTRNTQTEVLITGTFPVDSVGLGATYHIENNAAAIKNLDVDYFDLLITGLTR